MNFVDVSFGSDVKFSSQKVNVSDEFFKKDSINAGKLATELYKGDISVSNIKSDSKIFNAFGSTESSNSVPSSPPTPPSTRPYLWKYQ